MSDATSILFLVGFMGSGKTTVGQRLAARLGGRFVDLDERIARAAGCSISELFRMEGETGFRRREHAVLIQVCAELLQDNRPWNVVALGGGTFTRPENRNHIRQTGYSVWLDVPFDLLATRVALDGSRPLWTSADEARLRYKQRQADYAHADIHLPVGTAPPGQVVEDILRALSDFQRQPIQTT
ncbi:MAG: shikimate kinase [Acidobacteriota bacterium]